MFTRAALSWLALVPFAASAQSLSFRGVPAEVRLAGRTPAVTVERLDTNGAPITSETLVVLVTAPLAGQVSTGPEPFSAWGPTATVNIAAGSSLSAPVYFRSGVRGPSSWTANAPGFPDATAMMLVRADGLTCDVETGTRLDTDPTPGCFNTLISPYPQSTLTASMSAAHRGNFGLRLVDGESSNGNAADLALFDDGAPVLGDLHLRAWVRVVTTNSMGQPIIAQLTNGTGVSPSLLDLKVRPNLSLAVGGFGSDAGYSEVSADAGLRVGAWHLLEFSVSGSGSADGGRHLWLDGVPLLSQPGVDFSDARMSIGRVAVGQPYADGRRWLGTIDFDDIRTSAAPLASRLEVQAPDGGFVGECLPLEVQLRASFGGGLAATREAVPVTMDAGGEAELFVDSSCGVPGDQLVFPPDASVVRLSFRASQPVASVQVSTPDFLPGLKVVEVSVPPALGILPAMVRVAPLESISFVSVGGTARGIEFRMFTNASGGGIDPAGLYRAGPVTGVDLVEARDSAGQAALGTVEVVPGPADAGGVDAGEVIDGGMGEPRTLSVGCTCGDGGAALPLLLFVLIFRGRRAR